MILKSKLFAIVAGVVTLALVGFPAPSRVTPASAARLAPIPGYLRTPAHWTHAAVSGELAHRVRELARGLHAPSAPHQLSSDLTIMGTSALDLSAAIRKLGGTVQADIRGHVFVARLPFVQVDALANTRGALSIELPEAITPALDVSLPATRADQVWSLPAPNGGTLQGGHVLVGVVDSGIG